MRRHLIAVTATALAVAGAAAAQQKPAAAKPPVVIPAGPPPDMTLQPAVGAMKSYAPPKNDVDQLPNGLKIIAAEDDRFPQVNIRISLRAGDARQSPEQAGLAEAEAALLTAGTPTRSALQIAQFADGLGGEVAAAAGPDFLTISGSALSQHADALMQLLADIVLRPTFPQNEVDLRKANMLEELQSSRGNPEFLADALFTKLLYGPHPYAVSTPSEESIARITRDALVKFHTDYFLPNNQTVMVVVGQIKPARAEALARQNFDDWKLGKTLTPPPSPDVTEATAPRLCLIDRPGSVQATIVLGNLGITRKADDFYAFQVANEILGGGFNSRLVTDIREAKGFAYGIGSYNSANLDLGAWMVSTQVRNDVAGEALAATLADMEKLRSAAPAAAELEQAKNYLSGNFILGLETQAEVASSFIRAAAYNMPDDYLADWVSHIQDVEADSAQAAAKKHMHPGSELIVVVGDAKALKPQLEKLGTVERFDEKLMPVKP